MDDQNAQNRRAEKAERVRAWREFTIDQKAAALMELSEYLPKRQDLAESHYADVLALLVASHVGRRFDEASPVQWSRLSNEDLAGRLREVADWTHDSEAQVSPGAGRLKNACLDLAEQLERRRETEWESGGR